MEENYYNMPVKDGKEEIVAFGLERRGEVKHSNGELTQLMMARIIKQKKNATLVFDDADFIAFEIPVGQEITEQIMQIVMRQYAEQIKNRDIVRQEERRAKEDMEQTARWPKGIIENLASKNEINVLEQSTYYLGRLAGKKFTNKSKTVEPIVQKAVKEKKEQREEQIRKNNELNRKEEAFRQAVSAVDYIVNMQEEMQKIRESRRENPSIRKIMSNTKGTEKYMDYNGVDIHTGEILRMRRVDKIGKDGNGTYLYTAYLSKAENETDVEWGNLEEPAGFFVCFELQKRLEDIVKEGKAEEIKAVLELLSEKQNFVKRDELTYIGEIDKKGQIHRRESSTSRAIATQIKVMQKNYKERRKKEEQQEK